MVTFEKNTATVEPGSAADAAEGRASIQSKTHQLLAVRFPGSRAEIGWTPGGEMLCGFLGWDGFRGLGAEQTTDMVDHALDAGLTPEERRHVDFIIPMPMNTLLDHLEPLD